MNRQSLSNKQLVLWTAVGCFLSILFTVLFYRQAVMYQGGYPSDLPSHINYALAGRGYSILYVVLAAVLNTFHSELAAALFISVMVLLTWLTAGLFIEKKFDFSPSQSLLFSTCLLFLCAPYIPKAFPFFYRKSLMSQPWHNITYIGMRLFALLTLWAFLNVAERYRDGISWKDWLKIALPLMISASIKPNFLLAFSIALLLVLIVDFVRDLFSKNMSFSRLGKYVVMGSVVFPSLLVLYQQSRILYGVGNPEGSSSGIQFVVMSSTFFSDGAKVVFFKLVRPLAFPTLVYLYNRYARTREFSFTFLMYLVALAEAVFLAETGPRADHGNFYWGLFITAYLLFLYAVPWFVRAVSKTPWAKADIRQKVYAVLGGALLSWHLVSGLYYFVHLLRGNSYFI